MDLLTSRQQVQAWSRAMHGLTIGFVPTMGALHRGHLSLVKQALASHDRVIASIFVNPTQFGPNEDFQRYPREPAADAQRLREAGCHALFLPTVDDIYPTGHQTTVRVSPLENELCGSCRPGHFQGVATVVAILFNLIQPHHAYFGKKDFQQWVLIRRMVADLGMNLQVHGVNTIRETDGLALSSRNRYLSPEDRPRGLALYQALVTVRQAYQAGERQASLLEHMGRAVLQQAPVDQIDYVALRNCETLTFSPLADDNSVLLIAARVGGVRLIDNMAMAGEDAGPGVT